jgi:hypothetical protein
MVAIKSLTSDATKVAIDYGSGPVDALYLSHGQLGSKQQGDSLAESLTALGEVRIPLDDLPADDPDKTIDPADGERLFWERVGPTWFLVSRSVIIENPIWDGTSWSFTARRARGA